MADSTTSSMPVGTTGAGGGNMLRITGLNTGLDVDAMVKKMLTADQTKIDQAKQAQQLIQWRQEAYQSIIKDVKDMQSAYFDITNNANYLLSSGSYNNMTANSSDDTTVSVNAAATAVAGNYKISVSQLAQAAAISGSSVNSQYAVSDASKWNGNIDFTINGGSPIEIDLSGLTSASSPSDVVSKINSQLNSNGLNGKVSASIVTDSSGQNYIKFTPASGTDIKMTSDISDISASNKTLVSASLSTKLADLGNGLDGNIVLNLNYNGKAASIKLDNSSTGQDGSATVSDLITAIKNATGGAVTGKFDDMTGKFTLQTTSTGSTSDLQIQKTGSADDTNTDLLAALGFSTTLINPDTGLEDADSSKNTVYGLGQGQDANVTITEPGSSTGTTLTESSNNFTVNGVSYNITGITPSDSPTSISVTQDTSKVHDLISNFIDKYNNLIGEIQDKLSEKKDFDYSPLTDSQKSSMSDTDITNWESKAKEGILENDDNLEQLLSDLTSAFNSPVLDSSGKSVSTIYFGSIGSNAIGIDTSDDYSQGAKLSITDDQQFTDALTNHADDIMKLFTTTSDSTDTTTKFNQSGIFQRINDIINNNVGMIGTTLNSGTLTKYANLQDDYTVSGGGGTGTLPDQIYTQQLLISTLTDRMSDDQTKYYNQFTQLETAMEQLNAQQSTLSMYLGSS